MRKRYVAAALAVASLTVAGGLAVAESATDAPPSDGGGTPPTTVTLPTGDTVEIIGDALVPKPAAGRADIGFRSTRLPGHDRVIMPLDQLGKSRTDERLYNVDALLRNGYSDARDVKSPDALGNDSTSSKADADATKVTVEYSWLDGSDPEQGGAFWVNLDTNETGSADVTKGKAELDLKPGKYSLIADMLRRGTGDEPWEAIGTVMDVTVTDEAQTITVDGGKAKPVEATLDNDAEPRKKLMELFTGVSTGKEQQIAHTINFSGEDKLYAIPNDETAGHPAGFTLQSQLTRAKDTYSLFNIAEHGIPADPSFAVRAKDLAVREASYPSLGGDAHELGRSDWGYHKSHTPYMYPLSANAKLGSSRTEHYTAGPDVGWTHFGMLEGKDAESPYDNVIVDSGQMKPGTEDMPWLSAPLSVRVPGSHSPYFNTGLERWPSGGKAGLLARVPMFTSGSGASTTFSRNLSGKAVISKDGRVLAEETNGSEVYADLAEGDEGRYTVAVEAKREVAWTPLGTRSTATWEFDSKPVEEYTVLEVSAARFGASGISGGYAKATKAQKVTLDFETQPGAEDRSCEKLGFEVSYDDGKTWKKVNIDRDGDHAEAKLKHPSGAKFVSVRFSATDDKGQTVKTSTIRSYGLK